MRCFCAVALLGGLIVLPVMGEDLVQVKGKVVLDKDSKVPNRTPLVFDKDKDVCAKDTDPNSENWVVDPKTRGIRDVIVYIVSEPTAEQAAIIAKDKARAKVELVFDPAKIPAQLKAPPKEPVVFDQPCCRYIPHVAVGRVGQPVLIKNSAPIPHNAQWTSANNGEFNPLLAPGGQKEVPALVAERNVITIGCTIHPWMKAYLKVVDTPYYAVTDKNGEFTIKDLPAGKYRIVYFHPEGGFFGGALGRFGTPIEIKPTGGDLPQIDWKIE
ncbi:MAG: hypothetical protein N2112_11385 [Gemmataceae bacterium]|jgi:hypothetical protein|nr:hypothetical protein [Gemmataceae bacterium]